MKTVVASIGNSDDKLTQKEWAEYVRVMDSHIQLLCAKVHFFGGSANWMPWQNVTWWLEIEEADIEHLEKALKHTRTYYKQESVALLIGETKFI